MDIKEKLALSLTPYHAVAVAAKELEAKGFERIYEGFGPIERGRGYYIIKDGSALIAFRAGEKNSFNIAAAHTDSPALKIKYSPENASAGCTRLAVENYGGGLQYSRLDTPLAVAGRAIVEKDGTLVPVLIELDEKFVIPSVAIHYNRKANDGVQLNVEKDMQPLASLGKDTGAFAAAVEKKAGGKVKDHDLFLVSAEKPFNVGFGGLICSPRADDLTGVFASIEAICAGAPKGIAIVYIADNEEIGSRTHKGAASSFLRMTLGRIAEKLGFGSELDAALASSFFLSVDNAHADHPNHPELADASRPVPLGSGVVIKHHAGMNYSTDGLSSAVIRKIFEGAGVRCADFFMRADLPAGSTLGSISSSQVSIRSADVGIAQLAMHSSAETFASADYDELEKGLAAFFSAEICAAGDGVTVK